MKVSIIIPNYNYGRYVARAIRSALMQDFRDKDFEVLVVDDASTDHSLEVISSFGTMIRTIAFEKNRGLPCARNEGIRQSRGEYLVFLDADDFLNRQTILVQSLFMDWNQEWDAVSVDYLLVNDQEEIIGRSSAQEHPIACGIMYRRQTLIEVGMFDEQMRMHEEKDLRIRFQKEHNIHHIDLPLYRYRQHDTNMTRNQEMDKVYSERLFRKHFAPQMQFT